VTLRKVLAVVALLVLECTATGFIAKCSAPDSGHSPRPMGSAVQPAPKQTVTR